MDKATKEKFLQVSREETLEIINREAQNLNDKDLKHFLAFLDVLQTTTDIPTPAQKNEKTPEEIAEQKKQEEAEKFQEIQDELATLRREKTMSDYVAKFVAQGYTPELASETAAALIDGKMDTVFNNQASFLKAFGEQIKADLQKGTPPPSSGNGGKKPQDMNYAELCQYLADNPGAEL